MEFKRNDATRNRPEGDRVIDAPYVFVDMDDFIDQLKDEKAWDKNDRNGITVFKSDALTAVITILHKDTEIPENTIDGYFTVQLLKGEATVTTPDGEVKMKDKQMICFHPGIPHTIKAESKCVFLLTNYSK